ncbi:class I SAM-dependent methyltransferase [Bacillus sp. STP3]|uniref:methyltransferase domain-containing protein n=1 Tax=Bacillus sp. STP3 TaxID=2338393 RepID=UPI0013DE5663
MGVGSTAVAAIREGRRTICIDQNADFVKEMRSRVEREQLDLNAFEARQGDSRDLSGIDDGSIDLIVTSPPYWDKADVRGPKHRHWHRRKLRRLSG